MATYWHGHDTPAPRPSDRKVWSWIAAYFAWLALIALAAERWGTQ